MTQPIFCQTVGLELEVTDVNPRSLNLPHGWTITDDASVTTDVKHINGIPITDHSNLQSLNLHDAVFGGEILTSIIDTQSNYISDLKYMCSRLVNAGEPDQSNRAGLHVHLSFTNPNLAVLKTIIKLGCYLEDVFFLLGGMGYPFRGIYNDCSYCRPITPPGPQAIEDRHENVYPCMVVDDLLLAKDIRDFKVRLGDYPALGESKYIPIRYHWLNLWNIWKTKQTLEFRIFNHTLKPRYIEVAIETCKAFGETVMSLAYNPEELSDLPCNSVYAHRNKADIIDTFISFATPRIDSRVIDCAVHIMDEVDINSIRFERKPYWFHLRYHRHNPRFPYHWVNERYRPSIRYSRSEVTRPYFEDIHNIRNEARQTNRINPTVRTIEDPRRVTLDDMVASSPVWTVSNSTSDGPVYIEEVNVDQSINDFYEEAEEGSRSMFDTILDLGLEITMDQAVDFGLELDQIDYLMDEGLIRSED